MESVLFCLQSLQAQGASGRAGVEVASSQLGLAGVTGVDAAWRSLPRGPSSAFWEKWRNFFAKLTSTAEPQGLSKPRV